MIVNLNLQGKNVLVIGGGTEALKRICMLKDEQCTITAISKMVHPEIMKLAKNGEISHIREDIKEMGFFTTYCPDIVITTTNNHKLNQEIIKTAKEQKIMVYSSDNPESSDFANLGVIDIEGAVRIAISTGGKSPAMAKKLKEQIGKNVKKMVSVEDIYQIKIQNIARKLAQENITSQKDRKAFLTDVINDEIIKQLIKDKMIKKAESRVITMLRNRD
ncbi:MAG: bifunctional precorrin-2 dehydrogenase/sirohydrochlorin ferrochelatase [Thaumarchaeota archaeon]|nr:bifunctional precorrin-2 dehydrogenase/sirohydrochlorin ferrochelatase [Nitrososphaerota archaeon]